MNARTSFFYRASILLSVIAFLFLCASVFAQEQTAAASRAAHVLDSMPHAKRISEAALSPDGTQVAYILDGELTIAPAGGTSSHAIAVEGNLHLRDVDWSADSKRVVFLADLAGDVPDAQVWTAAADGGALKKHEELKGYVQSPRFSPDGSKLSVLFIEGMPRVAGPLQPMTPLSGVIDEKIYEQRIAAIDLETGHLTQVTPPDVYIYEYDWTPDGQAWVASAAHGSGDANWWIARLYTVNAQSGELHEIYKPKLQIAEPRVSPDGKHIAFIEGLMSDEGSTGGDVHVIPVAGGSERNLTPAFKASASALAWAGSDHVMFAENIDGNSGFGTVSLTGGAIQTLWTGEESAAPASHAWIEANASSSKKFVTAVVRQSAAAPPEVWAGAIGDWNQTHQRELQSPAHLGQDAQCALDEWEYARARLVDTAQRPCPGQKISSGRQCAWRPIQRMYVALG